MGRIDPAAKSPSRIRRNWGRTTKGAITGTLNTVQPVTIDAQERLVLNIAANGGIDTAVGALQIKLDSNPGLVTGSGGLKILLDSTPGLVLGSGGIKVLLDATNPCLQLTSGLAVTVHSAGALSKTSTGLQVAVDGATIEISSNAIRVKDGGITGPKLATGLTLPPFKLSEAANGAMGTISLAGGTAVVNNTSVTAVTRIFLSIMSPNGGTPGFLDTATRTPGTSFTITSTSGADTSIVAYLLIEPV